jgi:hypothetical protein
MAVSRDITEQQKRTNTRPKPKSYKTLRTQTKPGRSYTLHKSSIQTKNSESAYKENFSLLKNQLIQVRKWLVGTTGC